MKTQNLLKTSLLAGVCALAMGFANTANAATQTWNPGGLGGGSGSWNANNWDSAAAWTSGNTAIFGGTAGTVDLNTTTQTVGGLTFNVGAYTLSNGTLALNGAPTTFTTTNGTTTFASSLFLTGAGGIQITKTGAGTLALIANNSGLGTGTSPVVWTVTGGTLSSGVYSSALSIAAGTCLGAVPTTGTVQVVLDAGTLIAANNVASNRWIQVNAAGGTLQINVNQSVDGKIFNSADASHTLYAGVGTGFTGSLKGVISGNGSLTKIDAGTLTLTGNNTYTGLTTITAGKLNVGSALALGGGGNITFSGGSLQYSANNTADYSAKILNSTGSISIDTNSQNVTFASAIGATNTGNLTKSGAGTLTLSGNNSYTGGTTISAGTIAVANNGAFGTGSLTISEGATLANNDSVAHALTNSITTVSGNTTGVTFAGSQDLTLNNGLTSSSAAVKLTKTGSSTLTLNGASNIGGFQLGGISAATAAVWTVTGGTLNSATGVYSSVLNAGTVGGQALGNNPNFTNNGAQIILDQGTLNAGAQFNAGRTLQVNAAGGTMENLESTGTTNWQAQILNNADSSHTFYLYAQYAMGISGVISGGGSLTKMGSNTLTLSGNNSYTGATILNQGTLTVGTGGTLGASTAALVVNNNNSTAVGNAALLNLATAVDTSTGSLSGSIATPTSGTNTATINTQTGRNFTVNQTVSGTYAGVIAGAGTFTKAGVAALTLTGTNTYTGATTVSTGTLLINGSTSSSSAVTVNAGATLGGNGTVGGLTTVNGDLKPGNSPGVLTFSSGLTLNGTTTMEINGSTTPGTDFDKVVVTSGTTTLGGALAFSFGSLLTNNVPINLFSFSGTSLGNFSGVTSTGSYSGTWSPGVAGDTWTFTSGAQTLTFSEVNGTLNVVPEPATWALLAFSLTTVMVLRRRRS
jgi:autotransporter-associated beta strand protein